MTTETERELMDAMAKFALLGNTDSAQEIAQQCREYIDEHKKCAVDLLLYGCAYMRNGKRIDPREITHPAREDIRHD